MSLIWSFVWRHAFGHSRRALCVRRNTISIKCRTLVIYFIPHRNDKRLKLVLLFAFGCIYHIISIFRTTDEYCSQLLIWLIAGSSSSIGLVTGDQMVIRYRICEEKHSDDDRLPSILVKVYETLFVRYDSAKYEAWCISMLRQQV